MAFLRRIWNRYSKLGKKRKKKRVWRKPKGRHNKMREKRKGYPKVVSIGYKKSRDKNYIFVNNLEDLKKVDTKSEIILGKMGKKKKLEAIKIAKERGINIVNIKKIKKEENG
jgi:large subunit ribosomal protein L32e